MYPTTTEVLMIDLFQGRESDISSSSRSSAQRREGHRFRMDLEFTWRLGSYPGSVIPMDLTLLFTGEVTHLFFLQNMLLDIMHVPSTKFVRTSLPKASYSRWPYQCTHEQLNKAQKFKRTMDRSQEQRIYIHRQKPLPNSHQYHAR